MMEGFMKKIIVLLSLFVSYSYSQIQPTVSDFLISGIDNSPSTSIQSGPRLYVTNSDNFVAVWTDYKEGEPSVYAQKFDRYGNKTGVNFKTSSYASVHLNKEGYLLSLHEDYVSFLEDSYFYLTAKLINNSNQEVVEQEIYSARVPWCGTGFISGEDLITASDNSFYFLTNFGGNVSLVKIENAGNIKPIDMPFVNLNHVTQIASSATSGGNYFFAWINGVEEDSLETGLYATFINSEDSVIISRLPITQLADSVGIWEYVGNYNLKSIALNDSTYKLFWLNNASPMLYSVKLNIKGEIVSDIDSLLLPGYGSEYGATPTVILTNKNEEGFYLYVSEANYNLDPYVYTNSFIKYDVDGQRQGDILTEAEYSSANNLFNTGGDKFFRVSSDEGDIFLDKLEYFTLLESQKINDDGSGNNQRNQKLTKYDDNNVFSIWSDEEKIYGIRLDKNGNIISEKIELISTDILFFPDKEFIATWIKSANNSSYAAGYTMFNQEFNEKFSKTLFTTNSSYNLRMKIQIFSDTTFVVLLNSQSELKLIEETKNGNTLKEKVIVSGQTIYGEKIFPDELILPVNSFWMTWDSQLQKFSVDLEPLSEVKYVPYTVNSYIGDDRFLTIQSEYDLFYVNGTAYGTIIDSNLDTVKSKIPLSYFKSGSYNLLVDRLDNNEFLAINKFSNKYYGRAFSNEGIATKDSFVINKYSSSYAANLNYIANNDKVFFTWSDARTPEKGYDVYGSIFNLNSITSVKEITSEIPRSFYLFQNYPNPFNPSTRIRFSIPEFSHVLIKIYDVLGNEIATLVDEDRPSGGYEVSFNGSNLASGFYFYRITAGNYSETRKMILLK